MSDDVSNETEIVEAVIYDKSMNAVLCRDGIYRIAYVIIFIDYDNCAHQCLMFDKPSLYASFEKGNVCNITVRSKLFESSNMPLQVENIEHKLRG